VATVVFPDPPLMPPATIIMKISFGFKKISYLYIFGIY